MSSGLPDILKDRIRRDGPMTIGAYMEACLAHPEYGYYMTRDPFGVAGDFITAPEVSQLFGEMIGVWLSDLWIKLGAPSSFTLLECGPGRGTLMADLLRATKGVQGFHGAARIVLMEISPVLKAAQKIKLSDYDPVWIDDLEQLNPLGPVYIIGNEFLDALPVQQVVGRNGQWMERAVSINGQDAFEICEIVPSRSVLEIIPDRIKPEEGKIFEASPVLNQFIKSVDNLLKKQNGAALFIDYGHVQSACGETLQALRAHRFENIFDTPGTCDLTAHVDFENLARLAQADGVTVHGPVAQGPFLKRLGIELRAAQLCKGANMVQAGVLRSGLQRLIDTAQMGSLFKVMALCHGLSFRPAGFHEDV